MTEYSFPWLTQSFLWGRADNSDDLEDGGANSRVHHFPRTKHLGHTVKDGIQSDVPFASWCLELGETHFSSLFFFLMFL